MMLTHQNGLQNQFKQKHPCYSKSVDFTGIGGEQDWGLSHVPAEAGALIEAPPTEYSVLTSKRFFRYQPGRVSAGTFGVKFGRSPITTGNIKR